MEPRLIDLQQNIDDRGTLFEAWRHSWETFKYGDSVDLTCPQVQQVYCVHNPVRNTIRAFHRHEYLWDGFCIIKGSAKFHLFKGEMGKHKGKFDDEKEVEYIRLEDKDIYTYTLRATKPQLLIVPPTIWHGWASLEDDTLLLSIASHEYNAEEPDEERIDPYDKVDIFHEGSEWGDQFEWEPEAK